jgi:hypothetical protein
MFDSDDPWPSQKFGTGPTKHLHALGIITLNFNLLEAALYLLLEQFMSEAAVDYFFLKMSNEERMGALRHFSASNGDPDITERIEFICTAFSICAENRNLLMHSRIQHMTSKEFLSLAKMGKQGELNFDVPLKELRRVADEMWDCIELVYYLSEYIPEYRKFIGKLVDRAADPSQKLKSGAPALPKIPPKPRKLDPHLQLVNPTDEQPQLRL